MFRFVSLSTVFLLCVWKDGVTSTLAPFHDPNYAPSRDVIVHLFEWRWTDIAQECERFLGPMGYAGVQVSPPNENAVLVHPPSRPQIVRPWYERYQPVSYELITRSGTEEQFRDMVHRCNTVGVRIYVDAVINHMTYSTLPNETVGTGGNDFDSELQNYPAVPYTAADFHTRASCPSSDGTIQDYSNKEQVRNCKLEQLNDLDQSVEDVRNKIADYMNHLLGHGVAGFRIDAAKHMWPDDLKAIYGKLENLSTEYFPAGSQCLIYQEVIDLGGEAIGSQEYIGMGRVSEFKVGMKLGEVFRRGKLAWLQNFGEPWGFLETDNALTFVENHDNQRGHGASGPDILTFFDGILYQKAVAFLLAWDYALKQVMSSYRWTRDFQNGKDVNDWVGPPCNDNYETLPVTIEDDGTCGNGWVCEHRYRTISQMVRFSVVSRGQPVTNWWSDGNNQIAFSRGDKAFFALNNDPSVNLDQFVQTGLPSGQYCDVASGKFDLSTGTCTGRLVTVDQDGIVYAHVPATKDPIMAVHIEAMTGGPWAIGQPRQQDFQRTLVLIYKQTSFGETVYMRGGIGYDRRPECNQESQKCVIPIRSVGGRAKRQEVDDVKYLEWSIRDSGEGVITWLSASSTPLSWTTNDNQSAYYNEFNRYGDHYWMLDVLMDCSTTEANWFEFKTAMASDNWEPDVHQVPECSGDTYRAQKPYESNNHMALCGKVNVFHYEQGGCIVNDF